MANVGGRQSRHAGPGGPGSLGAADTAGLVVMRTRSRRTHAFELHPREAVSDLAEVGAVYCYARAVPANADGDASPARLAIGFVGETHDMAERDAEHAARGDFTGHGLDLVLILRIDRAGERADIERDLIYTYDPVLNDLLRGIERGGDC